MLQAKHMKEGVEEVTTLQHTYQKAFTL